MHEDMSGIDPLFRFADEIDRTIWNGVAFSNDNEYVIGGELLVVQDLGTQLNQYTRQWTQSVTLHLHLGHDIRHSTKSRRRTTKSTARCDMAPHQAAYG